MHRWSRLNDRQLTLLARIAEATDPVISQNPELALTARVLKERGLITMPKQSGKWRAEITDADASIFSTDTTLTAPPNVCRGLSDQACPSPRLLHPATLSTRNQHQRRREPPRNVRRNPGNLRGRTSEQP